MTRESSFESVSSLATAQKLPRHSTIVYREKQITSRGYSLDNKADMVNLGADLKSAKQQK